MSTAYITIYYTSPLLLAFFSWVDLLNLIKQSATKTTSFSNIKIIFNLHKDSYINQLYINPSPIPLDTVISRLAEILAIFSGVSYVTVIYISFYQTLGIVGIDLYAFTKNLLTTYFTSRIIQLENPKIPKSLKLTFHVSN